MTRYTEKQKLAAVTAYRKGTGGLRATASAHDVGVDSLRAWIAAYEANGTVGHRRAAEFGFTLQEAPSSCVS